MKTQSLKSVVPWRQRLKCIIPMLTRLEVVSFHCIVNSYSLSEIPKIRKSAYFKRSLRSSFGLPHFDLSKAQLRDANGFGRSPIPLVNKVRSLFSAVPPMNSRTTEFHRLYRAGTSNVFFVRQSASPISGYRRLFLGTKCRTIS